MTVKQLMRRLLDFDMKMNVFIETDDDHVKIDCIYGLNDTVRILPDYRRMEDE